MKRNVEYELALPRTDTKKLWNLSEMEANIIAINLLDEFLQKNPFAVDSLSDTEKDLINKSLWIEWVDDWEVMTWNWLKDFLFGLDMLDPEDPDICEISELQKEEIMLILQQKWINAALMMLMDITQWSSLY